VGSAAARTAGAAGRWLLVLLLRLGLGLGLGLGLLPQQCRAPTRLLVLLSPLLQGRRRPLLPPSLLPLLPLLPPALLRPLLPLVLLPHALLPPVLLVLQLLALQEGLLQAAWCRHCCCVAACWGALAAAGLCCRLRPPCASAVPAAGDWRLRVACQVVAPNLWVG
jgi:hypothetical protein